MGQVPQVLRYLLAGAAKDDSEVKLKEVRGLAGGVRWGMGGWWDGWIGWMDGYWWTGATRSRCPVHAWRQAWPVCTGLDSLEWGSVMVDPFQVL